MSGATGISDSEAHRGICKGRGGHGFTVMDGERRTVTCECCSSPPSCPVCHRNQLAKPAAIPMPGRPSRLVGKANGYERAVLLGLLDTRAKSDSPPRPPASSRSEPYPKPKFPVAKFPVGTEEERRAYFRNALMKNSVLGWKAPPPQLVDDNSIDAVMQYMDETYPAASASAKQASAEMPDPYPIIWERRCTVGTGNWEWDYNETPQNEPFNDTWPDGARPTWKRLYDCESHLSSLQREKGLLDRHSLGYLCNLVNLELCNNRLNFVHPDIGMLTALETCNMSHNR